MEANISDILPFWIWILIDNVRGSLRKCRPFTDEEVSTYIWNNAWFACLYIWIWSLCFKIIQSEHGTLTCTFSASEIWFQNVIRLGTSNGVAIITEYLLKFYCMQIVTGRLLWAELFQSFELLPLINFRERNVDNTLLSSHFSDHQTHLRDKMIHTMYTLHSPFEYMQWKID